MASCTQVIITPWHRWPHDSANEPPPGSSFPDITSESQEQAGLTEREDVGAAGTGHMVLLDGLVERGLACQ